MDMKNLKWFQEVCRCGSITKAAANLFITPQGLSKGIKNLENELEVTLLERTPNGVSLTPYGECLMVDFVLNFEEENPGMSLDYMEYPDSYVEREILKGNYDIGFGISPIPGEGLEVTPLFSSPVSLLVYEGHPLAERETVRFADLREEPLILESHLFKIHDLVKESCLRGGFEANIIYCTSGFSLCHKLTAQKRGISVIVDRISDDMSKAGMRIIPIEDSFRWQVNLVCREKNRNDWHIKKWKSYTKKFMQKKGLMAENKSLIDKK